MNIVATIEGAPAPANVHIGEPVLRREDPSLIAGRGQFVDDVMLPGMAYAAVLRSPHARARIVGVDASRALATPGVVGVLTGQDLLGKVGSIQPNWLVGDIIVPDHPVLAHATVNYVGDAVAFVVADTREAAYDALELIDVAYQPLEAVVDEFTAGASPVQIHEGIPGNQVGAYVVAGGDYAAAREAADHVLSLRLVNNRVIPSPIEPRALVAHHDAFTDRLVLYIPSQVPHLHRRWLAETLGWAENRMQIVAPHIGGGFGCKMHFYVEEVLVCFAAKAFGRPVKWTETRSESHLSTHHGRAHTEEVEVAFGADGRVAGLKLVTHANMGAYLSNMATGIPTINCTNFATGTYRIPNFHGESRLMLTNTVPVDAYRGAGRPEASYIIERAMDAVASHLGLDPGEVRRRNVILKHEFPYAPFGHPVLKFDSGTFSEAHDAVERLVDYPAFRERQARLRREGRYLGIGITNYTEICGVGPSAMIAMVGFNRGGYESAQLRVHSDGKAVLYTGSTSQGHGHATAYAQIVASELQLPLADVEVVAGDTEKVPTGVGTYNSRSMPVGGSAAKTAAKRILDKMRKYAAVWLAAGHNDLGYRDGVFYALSAPDTDTATFAEIARLAHNAHMRPEDESPGLDEVVFYEPYAMSSPNGSHAAIVEVDVETGQVHVLEYVAVDDVGVVINPLNATGQVHGGVVQGIGQALFEHAAYDASGQLLSGSLMDYNLPRSEQVPRFRTEFLSTPTRTNPLGAKGIGEAGTCAAPTAIVQAVCDALAPFGITHIDMPLTPPRVWRAIQDGRTTADHGA